MNLNLEITKKMLEKYNIKYNTTFCGIPVIEFNKEELIKILDIYDGIIKRDNELIGP